MGFLSAAVSDREVKLILSAFKEQILFELL